MADIVSEQRRSEIMSHIKNKNTSIELLVRKRLHFLGYRFRINYSGLPGKPDIVFSKKRIIIFIHGCFWHGHESNCRYTHKSQTRKDYWDNKILNTKSRDVKNEKYLIDIGWQTITIWECEIKEHFDETMQRVISFLNSKS